MNFVVVILDSLFKTGKSGTQWYWVIPGTFSVPWPDIQVTIQFSRDIHGGWVGTKTIERLQMYICLIFSDFPLFSCSQVEKLPQIPRQRKSRDDSILSDIPMITMKDNQHSSDIRQGSPTETKGQIWKKCYTSRDLNNKKLLGHYI